MFWSENSLDLVITYLATLNENCQSCILDFKLTAEEAEHFLADFRPAVLFVDTKRASEIQKLDWVRQHHCKVILLAEFKGMPLALAEHLERDHTSSKREGTSSQIIVYTSGTSGKPKGVILPISCLIFEAQILDKVFHREISKRRSFSILPLNHVYGLLLVFAALWSDHELILTPSLAPPHIRQCIHARQPHYLYVVPQFLTLIKNRIIDGIRQKPFLIRNFAFFLLSLNRHLRSSYLSWKFFAEIRQQIGASVDFFISGGAPLLEDVFYFFEALGVPVCNGYGLSETGPVISTNNPKKRRQRSVGQILAGVQVRIDSETNEIQVCGPNVFQGYFEKPEWTQEAFTADGWFRTGDLGFIDSDQYLFIHGRRKNLIVLPSGKKIQPEEVELHFSSLPFIKNCCLVYGGKKAPTLQLRVEVNENLSETAEIIESLRQHSKALAAFKRPQTFKLQREAFPMTTSFKIKRFLVQQEADREM